MENNQFSITGALFTNNERSSENSPHMNGTIEINGEKIKIVAWRQTSKNGIPYLSIKGKKINMEPMPETISENNTTDDNLPF